MTGPRRLAPPTAEGAARSARRWPLAFAPRFFILLVAGLAALVPAWRAPRLAGALLLWDLLVVGAWAIDLRRLPPPGRITVRRIWGGPPALEAETRVELEVRNDGIASVDVALIDDLPPSLRRQPPEVTLGAAAGRSGRAVYVVEPLERGDHAIGEVFLRYRSRARLAERWARADLRQTVRVYPNLLESKRQTIYLIRSRQIALEKRLRHRGGLGREFEGLRERRDGDAWRDVCWTASARRAKLITKLYRVERSQPVWIVLDTGRLLRERVGRLSKLDHAVNAALSLAQVALYSGDRVGLLAYGRSPVARVGAARGAAHLRALLEQLALLRAEPFEADHARAAETLLRAQTRRGLVVWLTDLAETATLPEVVESAARMTPRHLVFLVVVGQPDLGDAARRRPADPAEMYRNLAAQEMVQRRELFLETLKRRGVLAAELLPGGLATGLVNRYLEIKDRGLV